MKKTLFTLIFTLFFFYTVAKTQVQKLNFSTHLNINNGLSHNGVTSIIEDSKGYIWVATFDGLNRYDGYRFKIFKNTFGNKPLASNRIRSIIEDGNGNIWLGTEEGITIYNYSTDSFSSIPGIPLNKIAIKKNYSHLTYNKTDDKIYALTQNHGLLVFNSDCTLFNHINIPEELRNKNLNFTQTKFINSNFLLVASSKAIILFNLNTEKSEKVLTKYINHCYSIEVTNENKLLLTTKKGLYVFEYSINNAEIKFKPNKVLFKGQNIAKTLIDKNGGLWVGTYVNGLIYTKESTAFINGNKTNLSHFNPKVGGIRVSDIFIRSNGNCWIGTYDNGLYVINNQFNPFSTVITHEQINGETQIYNPSDIVPIDSNRVYILFGKGGTRIFNTITRQFSSTKINLSPEDSPIWNMFLSSQKNKWLIHGKESLSCIAKNSHTLQHIRTNKHSKPLLNKAFVEDSFNNIWVCFRNDILKLSLDKSGKVINCQSLNNHHLLKGRRINNIRTIYADPLYNYLWVGTDFNGLYRITINDNSKLNFNITQFVSEDSEPYSVSSNFITSIIRLPNNELWIGTEGGGICKAINSTGNTLFEHFTEKDGLSNNVVKNIIYSDEHLWLSTNKGLNKFDLKTRTFIRYSSKDGLSFEGFKYPGVVLPNGKIVLAGFNQFCYFNPSNIPSNAQMPKVALGDLRILNTLISIGDTISGRVLLQKQLDELDEIRLKYNENIFSIEVISLHFSNPNINFLRYQLNPINKDWIEVPTSQRFINYNGLQAGQYTLKYAVSNKLGDWSKTRSLRIIVEPPFWKTKLAFVIYIITLASIMYIISITYHKFTKLKYKIKIKQLEKDKAIEVNKIKLDLFSNISHEIKTPLTLISDPLESLISSEADRPLVLNRLSIIKRQSTKILQLINQVHDFQKADANVLTLSKSYFEFSKFINEIVSNFDFLAKKENKELVSPTFKSKVFIFADKDKVEKIINNLLSNSFKNTSPTHSISFEHTATGNTLSFKVIDTGFGIHPEDLPNIFNRFYQSKNKSSNYFGGSGIGLAYTKKLVKMHNGTIKVESSIGNGTCMTVLLPVVVSENIAKQSIQFDKIIKEEKKNSTGQSVLKNNEIIISEKDIQTKGSSIFFVEDNPELREYVGNELMNHYKVTTFINGKDCLKALEQEWPDIIISDILMPTMNGFELSTILKESVTTSHIPLILLTACSTVEEQIKGLEVGADAYIKKPFYMQHLIFQIESLIKGRKQLQKRFKIDIPLSKVKEEENSTDYKFLEDIYKILNDNYTNTEFDLSSYARSLYLNRNHFFNKIKLLTNQTPFELVKSYRLQMAANILEEKEATVDDAFSSSGFKSRSHFNRSFKNKYKVTPSQYIKNVRS